MFYYWKCLKNHCSQVEVKILPHSKVFSYQSQLGTLLDSSQSRDEATIDITVSITIYTFQDISLLHCLLNLF